MPSSFISKVTSICSPFRNPGGMVKVVSSPNESTNRASVSGLPDCMTFNNIIKRAEDGSMSIYKEERKNPPEGLSAIANSNLEELENV